MSSVINVSLLFFLGQASEEMRILNMPIHSSVLRIVLDYLYTDEATTVQGVYPHSSSQ